MITIVQTNENVQEITYIFYTLIVHINFLKQYEWIFYYQIVYLVSHGEWKLNLKINFISIFLSTDCHNEATFAMTNRGRFKLRDTQGYEYIKKYSKNSSTMWRCIRERHGQCRGKAESYQVGIKHVVNVYCGHNHPPSTWIDSKSPYI